MQGFRGYAFGVGWLFWGSGQKTSQICEEEWPTSGIRTIRELRFGYEQHKTVDSESECRV